MPIYTVWEVNVASDNHSINEVIRATFSRNLLRNNAALQVVLLMLPAPLQVAATCCTTLNFCLLITTFAATYNTGGNTRTEQRFSPCNATILLEIAACMSRPYYYTCIFLGVRITMVLKGLKPQGENWYTGCFIVTTRQTKNFYVLWI